MVICISEEASKYRKKHRQNRYIPVIAKVDYDFTTFHWAYKREDSDGLWQYTVDLMESHYTANTAVIYAVSRYRTEHNIIACHTYNYLIKLFHLFFPLPVDGTHFFSLFMIQTGSPNAEGKFPDGSTQHVTHFRVSHLMTSNYEFRAL